HGEERAGRQAVGLSVGGRQALLGDQIGADHVEFGRRAATVGRRHHDDAVQLLLVAAGHVGAELAEGSLAGAARALVDVVHDVVGDAGDHAFAVAAVEGVVVAGDQGDGIGGSHAGPRAVRVPPNSKTAARQPWPACRSPARLWSDGYFFFSLRTPLKGLASAFTSMNLPDLSSRL